MAIPTARWRRRRPTGPRTKSSSRPARSRFWTGSRAAGTLYFVDSITSYDDRMQAIGRATARILITAGEDFGILGAAEKDSGHEVRRFGEEMLFQSLRDHNADAIKASGAKRIVTADPHACNALKNDYKDMPPVEHISQLIAREVKAGKHQAETGRKSRRRLHLPRPLLSWDGTTKFTTSRALCSMLFPA